VSDTTPHTAEGLAAQVETCVGRYRHWGWPAPQVVLVSGSGLAVDLGAPARAPRPLADLLPFAVHEVEGHPHLVELLEPRRGQPVLYFRGRLHSYQGYDANQTVLPVRLAAALGARVLVMTNAAGGLVPARQRPGQLVLLRDHLNLTGMNPLRGEMPAAWGPRFPDLVGAYDTALRALALEKAAALGIALGEGVYAGLAGPSYETPAEARMLERLGADVAGMSTVLEVIAARHQGLRCLCLSLVSNLSATPGDHGEVLAAGQAAARDVQNLLAALLADERLYGSGGSGAA
jgi:purine-nucleoside phosphorylase